MIFSLTTIFMNSMMVSAGEGKWLDNMCMMDVNMLNTCRLKKYSGCSKHADPKHEDSKHAASKWISRCSEHADSNGFKQLKTCRLKTCRL